MTIADLNKMDGREFPARRRTRNIAGGAPPIQTENFSMGMVTLEPEGGQVPWHNQDQEEIYFIVEGSGEMCRGSERKEESAGRAGMIPPGGGQQRTNTGKTPRRRSACYAPAGDVDERGQ